MDFFSGSRRWTAVAAILLFGMVSTATAAEFDDAQKAEIQEIISEYLKENPAFIREYLLENPEILLEVSDKLRAQQIQQDRENTAKAMAAHREQLEHHPMSPVTGNPDGDVTLVEFFDYNCAYCKRVWKYVQELEQADPKLRIVWKEYPILAGRSPTSITAAKVAMAADRQGKYIETHRALMGARGGLRSDEQVFAVAEEVGLDMEKLKEDMESPEIKAYIGETVKLGEALGFQGTPTFVVNGAVIGGAVPKEYILAVIEAARAGELEPGELGEADLGQILQKHGT